MAINPVQLDSGSFTTNNSNTASITFVAGRFYLVVVSSRFSATPTDDQWSVTGASQTFTRVAERGFAAAANRNLAVFRCAPSSGSSGALTLTWGGAQTIVAGVYQVLEADEVLTTGTNGSDGITDVVENNNTGTPATVTITGTPTSGDVTFSAFSTEDDANGPTFEGSFSLIGTETAGTDVRMSCAYSASQDQTPSVSWSEPPANKDSAIIGFIFKAATASILDDSGNFPGFEAQSNPLVISVW